MWYPDGKDTHAHTLTNTPTSITNLIKKKKPLCSGIVYIMYVHYVLFGKVFQCFEKILFLFSMNIGFWPVPPCVLGVCPVMLHPRLLCCFAVAVLVPMPNITGLKR